MTRQPKKQQPRINEVLKKFYNVSKMNLEEAKTIICSIESDLIAILPVLQADQNDYRLGNATYGYQDDEAILNNLNYISDRWSAAFRIAWMLGIINSSYR